ncbi:MAG: FHA domain-containing protein [Pseudomonadota bacterium]
MPSDVWDAVIDAKVKVVSMALRVSLGKELLQTVRLDPEVTYIGRMAENHVVLDDPQVSRSHARIVASKNGFVLEDQQSENGIFVNGQRVDVHVLSVGDHITIGDHRLDVVVAEGDAKVSAPDRHMGTLEAEWRTDQTVQVEGEELEALRDALKREVPTEKKAKQSPTLDFSLKVGANSFEQSITFDKVRKREESDGQGNQIEITLSLGKWVLHKKVPL